MIHFVLKLCVVHGGPFHNNMVPHIHSAWEKIPIDQQNLLCGVAFFFFFGEILLLVILNYSVTIDTIMSTSFFNIKQHIIFYISSMSNYLSTQINFYIIFLTSSSLLYLINLSFQSQYWLFRHTYWNSILTSCVIIYLYFTF